MKTTLVIVVVAAVLVMLAVEDVSGRPRTRGQGGHRWGGRGRGAGARRPIRRPIRVCFRRNVTTDETLCNRNCPNNLACLPVNNNRTMIRDDVELSTCRRPLVCRIESSASGVVALNRTCPEGLECRPMPRFRFRGLLISTCQTTDDGEEDEDDADTEMDSMMEDTEDDADTEMNSTMEDTEDDADTEMDSMMEDTEDDADTEMDSTMKDTEGDEVDTRMECSLKGVFRASIRPYGRRYRRRG